MIYAHKITGSPLAVDAGVSKGCFPTMKSLTVRLLAVVAVLSLAANVLLYFRYSTSRPVVTLGGQAISRKQFQDVLESQAGQPVLSKLVFESLVTQAAAKAGLTPTSQDIQGRIDAIQRRAPQVLTPYSEDPVKMAQFRHDLGTSIALENLRMQGVTVPPAILFAYYAAHKADFGLPEQWKTTTVVAENPVDAQTAADALRQGSPPDVVARQPRLRVVGVGGYNPNIQTAVSPAVYQQMNTFLKTAKVGDVKLFPAGTYSVILRLTQKSVGAVPPLSQIKAQVERAARLAQAPSQDAELAKLYQAAHPTFTSDKYAAYFASVQQFPGVSKLSR